ncbi:MAG: FG-GAP-like repeat-containing protein [Thermodesulfobacteriota bacterium]|nr:FG-GAP-like repeat-containing protein [Thermodesulfobacteriota bacterium]
MRKYLIFFCIMGVILAGSVWAGDAKDQKKVAVFPFSVNSSEDLTYVRDGIWDMMISRLSASDEINVSAKQQVREVLDKLGKKAIRIADIYGFGKRLAVDYVVWGSITKLGNSVSLDAKLLDVSTYKTPVGVFEQCQGMDDVIPMIGDFAKKITAYVLRQDVSFTETATLPAAAPVVSTPGHWQSPDDLAVMKASRRTLTSVINPAFILAANPLAHKGSWMSRKYAMTFKGMGVGDVNNDGLNEVVVISEHSVMVYQKVDNDLKLLNKIPGNKYDSYLSVDVADINGNGTNEIIVTNMKNRNLGSFVLEFQDGKFATVASGLRWFLRVVSVGGISQLIGQRQGMNEPFSYPIYQIVYTDGKYTSGKKMKIPQGLSVYGLTIDSLSKGSPDRVITLNGYGHICIYQQTTDSAYYKIHIMGGSDKLIWKSDEVFGGSNNYFDFGDVLETTQEGAGPEKTFIKERILTYDIDGNGVKEVLVVKNLSSVGRMMKNARMFTRSTICNLGWDGLGLSENWRTKKIQGYVADYQIKDIDNDGEDEIVLAVGLGVRLSRSVIVAYDMDVK